MDTTKTINLMEWCAGYCGIGLGLKSVLGERLRTIAYCELEGFAQANLISKMEKGLLDVAPLWSDLKTFPCQEFHGLVDILVAGYPCQPFSAAGKRQGENDPRHLWPYIRNAIGTMEPGMCFLENVEGHISLGLSTVISDLEELGYKVSWGIFSASEVGAPHQRKRVFVLAYDQQKGLERLREYCPAVCWPDERLFAGNGGCGEELALTSGIGSPTGISRPQQGHEGIAGVANDCGDQAMAECIKQRLEGRPAQPDDGGWLQCATGRSGGLVWPSRPGEQQFAWEPPRVVGNSLLHGHTSSEITGGSGAGENQGRLQELAGGSASMGNTEHARSRNEKSAQDCWEQNIDGRGNPHEGARASRTGESMGNADHGRLASGLNAGSGAEADRRGKSDIEQAESGQIESNVGLHSHGNSDGLGDTKLSGLCDSELAEIREWMVKCDNRTDELRLLGNGVVAATAARAFVTLLGELTK